MEPFEWLVLGVGLVLGGVFGSKGKGVLKSAAKGYLIAGEKAQEWSANIREDFRDAIEEARYEKEQDEQLLREESEAALQAAAPESAVKRHVKSSATNSHKSEHSEGSISKPSAPSA
jgi:uncharacterized protein YdaT